jgi:hypothetical protein
MPELAVACDRNCNKCAFGVCVPDPACEALKRLCQQKERAKQQIHEQGPLRDIPHPQPDLPPLPPTPQEVFGCLSNLNSCNRDILRHIPHADVAISCVRDVAKCPQHIAKDFSKQTVGPIVAQYKAHLFRQAEGRWQTLPTSFIKSFADSYTVNLRKVQYATNIDTVHDQAITIGNKVFFPKDFNIYSRSDKKLMLHELEHVDQYERKGGEDVFIAEYITKAALKIIERRAINIHDDIGIERDAEEKANKEIDDYGSDILVTNDCPKPIRLTLEMFYGLETWQIEPGRSMYPVTSKGEVAHTDAGFLWWHAELADNSLKLNGGESRTDARGVNLSGTTFNFPDKIERIYLRIICDQNRIRAH